MTTEVTFDPFQESVHADPYPVFEYLRDEAPAYYNAERDFWALSRYEDVYQAAIDTETFSSEGRINLDDIESPGIPLMIEMDPPRHGELRDIVKRAFTPKRVADLEDQARALTRDLLATWPASGEIDFIDAFAGPLPIMVIAGLLGIESDRWVEFKDWSDGLVRRAPGQTTLSEENLMAGLLVSTFFLEEIEKRRSAPTDDMLSALVDANQNHGLTDEELLGFCMLLLVAGHETTTTLLSNSLRALAAHPDQMRLLAGEPDRIPAGVEEILRYDSPIMSMARTIKTDAHLHGETIPAGDRLLLLFGSANRDERQFENPDTFDVTRKTGRHLSFGHATHHCLGAALARLEARVALEELLPRLSAVEIDESKIERNVHVNIRSISKLPIGVEFDMPANS